MNYAQFRDIARDGDVVFFEPKNLLGSAIPAMTGGKQSHCGLALWVNTSSARRLMLMESSTGGCRMVSMSAYKNRVLTPIRLSYDWELAERFAVQKLGAVHYSVLDFVGIWVREAAVRLELPRIAALVPDAPGEVCSQFVASTLKAAGVPISSTLVSPSGLMVALKGLSGVVL